MVLVPYLPPVRSSPPAVCWVSKQEGGRATCGGAVAVAAGSGKGDGGRGEIEGEICGGGGRGRWAWCWGWGIGDIRL
jgi:hypothetical protein